MQQPGTNYSDLKNANFSTHYFAVLLTISIKKVKMKTNHPKILFNINFYGQKVSFYKYTQRPRTSI